MPKYVKHKLTELKVEIVGDFNIPFPIMGRTNMPINRETKDLNNTVNQVDLTNAYGKLYPTTQYIFFSNGHETFSKTDHI